MIIDCLKIRDSLSLRHNNNKTTAVFIQVGKMEDSTVYINQKKKLCDEYEISYKHISFPEKVEESVILNEIKFYNEQEDVHAIMVQLPLPKHINEKNIINAIDPKKDVDGFTDVNKGKVMIGDPTGIVPCTPLGITRILKAIDFELAGKNVVVVGRSNIVGKPMTQLLINAGATVTCCNSNTDIVTMKNLILNADLFISAININSYFSKEFFGEENLDKLSNIVAIDVGIFRVDGKLEGNISKDLYDNFKLITPVPKGVGPMTVAAVISNIDKCYTLQIHHNSEYLAEDFDEYMKRLEKYVMREY